MNRGALLLERLERRPDGYDCLLASYGSLAIAAYELAVARLMCWEITTIPVPSWREIRACAREIVDRSASATVSMPTAFELVRECRATGRRVLPRKPVY